jgi:hypothetical protein
MKEDVEYRFYTLRQQPSQCSAVWHHGMILPITFRRIFGPSSNFLILSIRKSRCLLAEAGSEAMDSAWEGDRLFTMTGEKIVSRPWIICRLITLKIKWITSLEAIVAGGRSIPPLDLGYEISLEWNQFGSTTRGLVLWQGPMENELTGIDIKWSYWSRFSFRMLYLQCMEDWVNTVVQEDKAPAHASPHQNKIFLDAKVLRLVWPGNSPDMNAIKAAWPHLKCVAIFRQSRFCISIKMRSAAGSVQLPSLIPAAFNETPLFVVVEKAASSRLKMSMR